MLISGAAGMIPAYFVHTLLGLNDTHNADIHVIALVRSEERAKNKFEEYFKRDDFELLVQDVCQPIKCDANIHIIIHGASPASPKLYNTDPVGTINANVLGTNNLLKLAHEKKAENFLFLSSGAIYGEPVNEHPIDEENYGYVDPFGAQACYYESKRLAETMCVAWFHQYEVPAKIVRISHTYGPGMQPDDGRSFADFVTNIVRGEDIILHSDGSAKRPFCYIADGILAMFYIIFFGKNGEAYNMANIEEVYSIRSLAEMLVGLFPQKKLKVVYKQRTQSNYSESLSKGCPVSIAKLSALGWEPRVTAKDGFSRTVESFEAP